MKRNERGEIDIVSVCILAMLLPFILYGSSCAIRAGWESGANFGTSDQARQR